MSPQNKEILYLYALLAFCIVLVLGRIRYSGTIHYYFLVWNLLLAFIPLWISQLYRRSQQRWPGMLWLGLCLSGWLLFFPNAPYITTDLMHLGNHPYMPRWFDPLMVLASAQAGLWAGFISLREFEIHLHKRFNQAVALIFVSGSWCLAGFGIYLGRVQRWNSWDLFHQPERLFADVLQPFVRPLDHKGALLMTGLYSLFLGLSYLFWRSAHLPARQSEASD